MVLISFEEIRCYFSFKNVGRLFLEFDYVDFGCSVIIIIVTVFIMRFVVWEFIFLFFSLVFIWLSFIEFVTEVFSLFFVVLFIVGFVF